MAFDDVVDVSQSQIRPLPSRTEPSFAVAFGGGGARGLAHIHVIEALDELGIRPVAIAGSSIGAIMGAAMSSGLSGHDIHDFARAVLCKRAELTRRMWSARPGTIGDLMSSGLRVSQFNIQRLLSAFLPEGLPVTFEDLQIPLKVTATDFFKQEQVVIEEGDLHSALCASAAIPAIFSPVQRDGRTLIDGGIYNPVPFDLVEGLADVVIAIDVIGDPMEDRGRTLKSMDMLLGANQIMMQAINQLKMKQNPPAIYLRPGTRYRALDFLKIDRVLAETVSVKDELKRAVETAVKAAA
ncbi:patatin-like phospholipase family protein [Tianweitania sp. BSSL-BM11]|uniref:Patatin-like phospholipase family protein n=1 Tax=Tianweitania aestuarii TaxID=2814886 RepID=A0ABS5RR77_9HYPH|nr:patatin-like phospholipase family protein [Tianweitania aestuarii]MBS9719501.1 patatin-like phospholipase family protein [Tianweitania aestuarii]